MNRMLVVSAGLAVGLAVVVLAGRGWSQGRPQGIPGFEKPAPPGLPGTGAPLLPTTPGLKELGLPLGAQATRVPEEWHAPQEDPDINRDILVTPEVGPWLILVHSYNEPNAPSLARALVAELRGPTYQLQAFVWNYGAEERRQELERIRKDIERQKEMLRLARQAAGPDVEVAETRIRVPRMNVRVQCAVVIGGYRDVDAARSDLERRIRKLRPLDAERFKLPSMLIGKTYVPKDGSDPLQREQKVYPDQRAPVNPFLRAFPIRNPSIDWQKHPTARDTVDIHVLRKLNARENLSLLRCPRPYTLAVKQFQVPTTVQQRAPAAGGLLGGLGFGSKSSEQPDGAAHNARMFAESLRQGKWEAYVLHTPYYSVITVGSFDSLEDPRLGPTQQALADLNGRITNPMLQMFPQAIPMPVPR